MFRERIAREKVPTGDHSSFKAPGESVMIYDNLHSPDFSIIYCLYRLRLGLGLGLRVKD